MTTRISPELWAEVKRLERGEAGPLSPLNLKVRTSGHGHREEFEQSLSDLGGRVSGGTSGGWLKISAPACQAPAVAMLSAVRRADPARAGWEPAGRRPMLAAVALLVAMGLAWAAWQQLEPVPPPSAPPTTQDPNKNQGGTPPQGNDEVMYAGRNKASSADAVPPRVYETEPAEPVTKPPVRQALRISKAPPGLGVDSLYQMGLTAYQEGRVEDAVRNWRAAVSSDPGRLGIRHSLGWALYELGMRNEAMAEFLVILREHPDDPDAVAALELIQGESEPGLATEGSGR